MAARRAGTRGTGWSAFVRAAKVALPLAALGALSSVFLLSGRPGPADPAPLPGAEAALRESRIGRPRFAGMTGDGAAIEVRARAARPGQGGEVLAEGVVARLSGPERRIDLTARTAAWGEAVRLDGSVRLDASDGWRVTMPSAHIALDRTELTAPGPIAGSGPLGRIEAGGLRLTDDGLRFHDRVTLLYRPPGTD